ncbi:hypothetical protein LZ30DRAFT_743162 [Colletotrichum cereale]|nr:hypothetical protein LZ30DRAFT_743162 [Colletotrichum cereale]
MSDPPPRVRSRCHGPRRGQHWGFPSFAPEGKRQGVPSWDERAKPYDETDRRTRALHSSRETRTVAPKLRRLFLPLSLYPSLSPYQPPGLGRQEGEAKAVSQAPRTAASSAHRSRRLAVIDHVNVVRPSRLSVRRQSLSASLSPPHRHAPPPRLLR